jgi:hypothetical protein
MYILHTHWCIITTFKKNANLNFEVEKTPAFIASFVDHHLDATARSPNLGVPIVFTMNMQHHNSRTVLKEDCAVQNQSRQNQ